MGKYILIDKKMRQIEREYLESLGYGLIEIQSNLNLYEEISSHVDVVCAKVGNLIIAEKCIYNVLQKYDVNNLILGNDSVYSKYPLDVKYNVCIIGKNAIHNFKFTDIKLKEIITTENFNLIDIKQGYSNCSIAVIDDNSAIVTDKKIAKKLEENNIEVLVAENLDKIKLLRNNGNYSNMQGFIGGCMVRIQDKIVVFGDLTKLDKQGKIRDFIQSRNLTVVDFKDYDVIDYGGIIEI